MNTLIVDSSVIVKWLNQTREQNLEQADKILDRARDGQIDMIAPKLAKYEVGNGIYSPFNSGPGILPISNPIITRTR